MRRFWKALLGLLVNMVGSVYGSGNSISALLVAWILNSFHFLLSLMFCCGLVFHLCCCSFDSFVNRKKKMILKPTLGAFLIYKAANILLQCIRYTPIIHPSSKPPTHQSTRRSAKLRHAQTNTCANFLRSKITSKWKLQSELRPKNVRASSRRGVNKLASYVHLWVRTQSDSFNHNKLLSKLHLPALTSVCHQLRVQRGFLGARGK